LEEWNIANIRWTIEDLNKMDTLDFAEAVLQERSNNLTNLYAPLSVKIDNAQTELKEIRMKLALLGNNGFVVDHEDRKVRIFVNILDYLRSVNVDITFFDDSDKKGKAPFIRPIKPEECFISDIVYISGIIRINGESYTRIVQTLYKDEELNSIPVYIRTRTLGREVYCIFTKHQSQSSYHANSKLSFNTWGEAEAYLEAHKKEVK
jgi:hypothetical protein